MVLKKPMKKKNLPVLFLRSGGSSYICGSLRKGCVRGILHHHVPLHSWTLSYSHTVSSDCHHSIHRVGYECALPLKWFKNISPLRSVSDKTVLDTQLLSRDWEFPYLLLSCYWRTFGISFLQSLTALRQWSPAWWPRSFQRHWMPICQRPSMILKNAGGKKRQCQQWKWKVSGTKFTTLIIQTGKEECCMMRPQWLTGLFLCYRLAAGDT